MRIYRTILKGKYNYRGDVSAHFLSIDLVLNRVSQH